MDMCRTFKLITLMIAFLALFTACVPTTTLVPAAISPTDTSVPAATSELADQALLESKYNEANTHYSQDEYNDAITDYTTVLQVRTNSAELYYRRGQAYLHNGDFGKAVADFDKALEPEPNDINT
jgi:tetratricopeptide (TPR) repeat protein